MACFFVFMSEKISNDTTTPSIAAPVALPASPTPFLQPLDAKTERLRAIVEPVLWQQGYELVLINVSSSASRTIVRLFIDKAATPGTVLMDDLERMNRMLGDLLDVEDAENALFANRYDLEVSSPGVDRPLTRKIHFAVLATHQLVKIKTNLSVDGAKMHKGFYVSSDDNGVLIAVQIDQERAPHKAAKQRRLPWTHIVQANTVYLFEEVEAPEPKKHRKVEAADEEQEKSQKRPKKINKRAPKNASLDDV